MLARWLLIFCCVVALGLDAKGRRKEYWEMWGTALYWNPCSSSFVVDADPQAVRLVDTDYEWGARVGGMYLVLDGSSYVSGEYTRFDATYTSQYGELVARRHFRYQTIDGRLGIALCPEGCDKFYAYLGGRYLDVREGRTGGPREQEALLSGGGVLAGAGGLHPLGKCVFLTAEAGGFLGLGEQVTRQGGREIPSEIACLPAIEARAGLRTLVPSQGYILMVEVGYEVLYYWGALRWVQPDAELLRTNLGFQGAYGAVRVRF